MQAIRPIKLMCELTGNIDIEDVLDSYETAVANNQTYTFETAMQKKITKMISMLNLAVHKVACDYLTLKAEETKTTDADGKLTYTGMTKTVYEILNVFDYEDGKSVDFNAEPSALYLPKKNHKYIIIYRYEPTKATTLSSEINLPPNIDSRVLAYQMSTDFSITKNLFDEANLWNEKFNDSIKKAITGKKIRGNL